jgi:hypothetical protein
MRKHRKLAIAFFVLCSVASGLAQMKGDRLLFTDPSRRYSIEFPKDWRFSMIYGASEPIATFVQGKAEAAVVVERARLRQRLEARDVTDVFAQIEADVVKENQPGATDVAAKLTREEGRPIVVIDYTRETLGGRQRVRQYSIPAGTDLYRITCMAQLNTFARHEAVMAAMVSTLKGAADLGGGAAAPRR